MGSNHTGKHANALSNIDKSEKSGIQRGKYEYSLSDLEAWVNYVKTWTGKPGAMTKTISNYNLYV